MKNLKSIGYLISTLSLLLIIYSVINGSLQKFIHFSGTLNEIGFLFIIWMLTVLSTIQTIYSLKK